MGGKEREREEKRGEGRRRGWKKGEGEGGNPVCIGFHRAFGFWHSVGVLK